MKMNRVLFVCLGNICRSPTAHGVFQQLVNERGLADFFDIDSAGTSGWHIDSAPDKRTMAAAAKRGFDLSMLRGRQVRKEDFFHYDYILAMDGDNLSELKRICPANYPGFLGLFLHFGTQTDYDEVPDPYYGGANGFETVLDLVEDACRGLLEHIQKQSHG